MEHETALSIHPDALPCLKRQQLENLCIRLGVKSSGKKSELIARLEGFATGHTIARAESSSSFVTEISKDAMGQDEDDKENDDCMSDLPRSSSIRIISKPRESHFASIKPCHDDEELEEVGMVLPSSGSHGSLSSLRRKRSVLADVYEASSVGSFEHISHPILDDVPSASSKPALYPWKKLLTSAASLRSISSSSNVREAAPSAKIAEMGLGLHASESQSSISSTMRKWLKGEGPSSVSGGDRRMTRSASAASSVAAVASAHATPDEPIVLSPRPKRKRSQESIAEPSVKMESPAVESEVPQRRIKPRPSRAAARPSAVSVVEPNPAVQERILAEVHARMAAKKSEDAVEPDSQSRSPLSTPTLPASPLKSVASRTRGRFSTQHEKNFDRMDSIANHYAAVRPTQPSREKEQSAGVKRARIASTEGPKEPTSVPTVRLAVPATNDVTQRTEEEREAVRRKLALARHRRRSSTAAGRKSLSSGAAKRVHTAATPAAKLVRQGFASKISGAMRGFVGAARGLANTNAVTAKTNTEPVMGPPPSSQKKSSPTQAKKEVEQQQQSSSVAASTSIEAKKKRSTFDLQASLARKPIGYVPYSAKETVGMLQSGSGGKVSPTKSSEKLRSSSITFPSSSVSTTSRKTSASRSPDSSRTSDSSNLSSTSTASQPATSSTMATPVRNAARGKTRSSTSTSARSSIRSPRKSQLTTAARKSNAVNAAVRRRQPSLQVAGQTMASSLMRERRMRTYALDQPEQTNSITTSIDQEQISFSPRRPKPSTVTVAGHGSPSKQAKAIRMEGRGRGKSSLASDRSHLGSINV